KLRAYEAADKTFGTAQTTANATAALKAVKALKQQVDAEKTKHKAFTEATVYLTKVATEAASREQLLARLVCKSGSADTVKAALATATSKIKTIKTYNDFTDVSTKSVLQKVVRTVEEACDDLPILEGAFAASGEFMKDNAIRQDNWKPMLVAV